MSDIQARFEKATTYVRTAPPAESSNEEKLQLYALFKQANEGDVKGSQPVCLFVFFSSFFFFFFLFLFFIMICFLTIF